MNYQRALRERRRLLHSWAETWYRRHARELATEGVPFALHVGRRRYWVTSEQALGAVSRTIHELDVALGEHPTWGSDADCRPCELAIRGLINRRFASRLVDQTRRGSETHTESLATPIRGIADGDITLGDTIAAPSDVSKAETMIWLREVLAVEPQVTREVIVRRLARETSEEISGHLELSDAAARQRISRFRRRYATDLTDAA